MLIKDSNFVCVVISENKILRENADSGNTTLLLPFNKDYSIRLKNLHTKRALVKVQIDGKNMTLGGLIINPKQSHDLHGQILSGNKVTNNFKFVKKTDKLVSQIGESVDDGIIRITVQFEKTKQQFSQVKWQPQDQPLFGWGGSGIGGAASGTIPFTYMSKRNLSANGTNYSADMTNSITTSFLSHEDGKTVSGSQTSVSYNNGYIQVDGQTFVYTMSMKGYDQNKEEVKESLNTSDKVQCKCGKKWDSSMKFCGYCGQKIVQKKKEYVYPDNFEVNRQSGRTLRLIRQAQKAAKDGFDVIVISHSESSSHIVKTSLHPALASTGSLQIINRVKYRSINSSDVCVDDKFNFSVRGFNGVILIDPSVFECSKYKNIIKYYNMFAK